METHEIIKEIKNEIKTLSVQQKIEKGFLRADHRTINQINPKYTAGGLQGQTAYRAATITATLNFYHWIRGKEYAHNVRDSLRYPYNNKWNELKKKYASEVLVEA